MIRLSDRLWIDKIETIEIDSRYNRFSIVVNGTNSIATFENLPDAQKKVSELLAQLKISELLGEHGDKFE